ncbi:MAG TPA: HAMP domain-containing sensor histidine kinase [Vicinamibacterales bacterium]|nr:HAMP domain-containing sensor histidine kinase [Vicinamibacterales bacterium]
MTLRARLFALVGAAIAVTVILVTWTVSLSARRSFAALDAQRTAAMVAQFRRAFASEGDQVGLRMDRVVSSEPVARLTADVGRSRASYAQYVDEGRPLADAQGLDFLDIVADEGTIVSSAHWPARFGYRHPWATAASASSRNSAATLEAIGLPDGTALGLIAVRSVPIGDRRLLFVGGRRLDETFLQSLTLPPGMRVLLYTGTSVPEQTRGHLIDAGGHAPPAAPLDPLIARVRQSAQESAETVEWPEGPESFDAIPLVGRDRAARGVNKVLGVLLVGSSGQDVAALVNRIRWAGVGFGALGILFGFVVSYFVSARVTRPVERLAQAARTVGGGDWNVEIDEVAAAAEIKELARAFETMTRQLVDQRDRLVQAERVAAWRELARRLAHELKNPLFPLRLTIDNLHRARSLAPAEFDEVFDESVAALTTGLQNLNTVVARFSDFAKMPTPEFSQVAPNEIIEQAISVFRAQLTSPGRAAIALTVDLDPRIGSIRADPDQIGRAIQNLLLNAIDAMPQGGALAIRTRRDAGIVRIDVADTGEGLTAEERDRLFTPYYTTKQHGTGLGLAIVQSVVADHAGKIWVESERGQGTIFHIELCGDNAD